MLVSSVRGNNPTIMNSVAKPASENNEKMQKLALPIISRNGECNIPGTSGGPVPFVACMAACAAAALINPFFIPSLPACHMACEMIGILPTP